MSSDNKVSTTALAIKSFNTQADKSFKVHKGTTYAKLSDLRKLQDSFPVITINSLAKSTINDLFVNEDIKKLKNHVSTLKNLSTATSNTSTIRWLFSCIFPDNSTAKEAIKKDIATKSDDFFKTIFKKAQKEITALKDPNNIEIIKTQIEKLVGDDYYKTHEKELDTNSAISANSKQPTASDNTAKKSSTPTPSSSATANTTTNAKSTLVKEPLKTLKNLKAEIEGLPQQEKDNINNSIKDLKKYLLNTEKLDFHVKSTFGTLGNQTISIGENPNTLKYPYILNYIITELTEKKDKSESDKTILKNAKAQLAKIQGTPLPS